MNGRKDNVFRKFGVFSVVMWVMFIIIFFRLVYLQVIKKDEYIEKVNNRSIREIPDAAPRGEIIDKNGVILATNNQSYVLVYNSTKESDLYFYRTMDKVFKILNDNNEKMQDEFELKVDPFRFDFKTQDIEKKRALEIRFKRDRGLNEQIQKRMFKDKKEKLTKLEEELINEELLKITPEETYNYLVKKLKVTPQDSFKNMLELYKLEPGVALEQFNTVFGIKVNDEFKKLLEQYKKVSKKESKNALIKILIEKYNIDSEKFDLEQQRKYMIIKDNILLQYYTGYKPIAIATNISKESAFIFLEKLNELPGIDVNTQPIRVYPFNELGSNFLGYISKISSEQERYEEKGYDISSDYIGVAGLEASLEERLKGTKGGRIVKLNKHGRIIEELGKREPYPGQKVKLTIDKNIQMALEKSLDIVMDSLQKKGIQGQDKVNTTNATRGAAVVVDVNSGGILGLASRPGFDPNMFAVPGRFNDELFNKYFNPNLETFGEEYIKKSGLNITVDELFKKDEKVSKQYNKVIRRDDYDVFPRPFYNYATCSLVPPGSTFKPMAAIAGLEEEVITPSETIYDDLTFTKNNYCGKDWNSYSFGNINVVQALEVSNNYFFFEVGDRLLQRGSDTLAKYAWQFGLGIDPKENKKITTGIEIFENYGQVFNLEYCKEKNSKEMIRKLYSELRELRKNQEGDNDGIDIEVNDSDSIEVKELKQKIQSTIKRQMKYRNVNAFSSNIKFMIGNLIDIDPKCKEKNFTFADLNLVIQKINLAVNEVYQIVTRPGNIYNASIGQGDNIFTPIQMANYIATIANGGNRYKLHLVDEYIDSNNEVINKIQPEIYEKIELKQSTIKAVKEGMLKVNSGEHGTAGDIFKDFEKFQLITAGKTGSATVSIEQDKWGRTSFGVYVGFAPYEKPEIAVCVIIFDGGHGGYVAPVAKSAYEVYFMDELKKKNYVPTPIYVGTENFMKEIYESNK